jgi:hypothetical protein
MLEERVPSIRQEKDVLGETPGRGPENRRLKEALDSLSCHVATATSPFKSFTPVRSPGIS